MAKIGGKRLSLYDKFKTNPSANMILNMPLAAGMSKGDMAKKKSKENKERVGFDENYDASENTIGNLTDVLGIADLYDKQSDRPTMPATGLTIPSSMFEDKKSDRPTMPATGMTIPSSEYKEKEEEDDRPKGLFGFLDGVELDGDALIKAGRAIEKGEGLGGAIEAYNDEMQANQAAEVAKQEKEYDRARQKELDKLDLAVKLNEIDYKQSMMKPEDVKIAEQAAIAEATSKKIKPGTFEFAEILAKKLDMIINKEKPMTSSKFMDDMTLDQLINTFQNPDGKGTAGNSANQNLVDGTGLMQE